jgi:hypothetical protein
MRTERGMRAIALARVIVNHLQGAGIGVKLFGGVAVCLGTPYERLFGEARRVKDIDLVVTRKSLADAHQVLLACDLVPERLMGGIADLGRGRYRSRDGTVDIDLYGAPLEFSHRVELGEWLAIEGEYLDARWLLMTKLQIQEFGHLDARDAIACIGSLIARSRCEYAELRAVCRRDWGWYRTASDNLACCEDAIADVRDAGDRKGLNIEIGRVMGFLEGDKKTNWWRLRSRIGRRVAWYEIVR